MAFDNYMGEVFLFYGVDKTPGSTKFKLDDTIWEAVEEYSEEDQYQDDNVSNLNYVRQSDGGKYEVHPIAILELKACRTEDFEGYRLADDSRRVWLRIGTDHINDYPEFTFEYTPGKPQTNIHSSKSNQQQVDPIDQLFTPREI